MNPSIVVDNGPDRISSWKVLIEGPLRRVAVLLWMVGVWRLSERVFSNQITGEWVVAACVATFAAFVLIAQLRWLWLSFVPIVLGLGVVGGITHQFEVGLSVYWLLSTIYVLTLWVVVPKAISFEVVTRLSQTLGFAGGHGDRGARVLIRSGIHSTGLAIVSIAMIGVAIPTLFFGAHIDVEVLWTAALGVVFVWMTGWHYQHRFHSYLVIGGLVFAAWLGVAYFEGRSLVAVVLDGSVVVTTLGLCFGFSLVAFGLERERGGLDLAELADSLYRRALRTASLWLALGVAIQQFLAGLSILDDGSVPNGTMFVLAGFAMLIANHAIASMRWSAGGIVLVSMGLYGVIYGWVGASDVLMPHPLTAALLVCSGVIVAWVLKKHSELEVLYVAPIRFVTNVAYIGALISAAVSAPFVVSLGSAGFLLITVLLFVTTFSVIRGPSAPTWRGLILAVLTSVLFYTLAASLGHAVWDPSTAIVWGFALWGIAAFGLEVWNRRFEHWSVEPGIWPWLGLLFVLAGGLETLFDPDFLWIYLIILSAYLGLMLRHNGSDVFAWLSAAAATLAAVAASDWWLLGLATGHIRALTLSTFLPALIGLNVLMVLASWWRRRGETLSARLGLPVEALSTSFTVLPTLVLSVPIVLLAGGGFTLASNALIGFSESPNFGVMALCLAVGVSVLHAAACLAKDSALRVWTLHSVWLCVYLTMLYTVAAMGDKPHAGFASALWALGFSLLHNRWGRDLDEDRLTGGLSSNLPVWVGLVATIAGGLMLFSPALPIGERVAVLFILTVIVGLQGWWRASRAWLWGAVAMFVLFQHALWLLWFAPSELVRVLPFMALVSLAVAMSVQWLGSRSWNDESPIGPAFESRYVLERAASFLMNLAAFEVIAHGVALLAGSFVLSTGWLEMGSVLLSYVLLVALWIRRAHRTQNQFWIYAVAILAGAAYVHLRTAWFGPAPVTVWDTTVLIGAAYMLFVVQRITLSVPTMHVVLILPLIALLTLPAELGSVHAGSTLMAMSVLYLLIRGSTGNTLPLYLGFMALNGAMYLWVPLWAGQSGLLQLYVIPAAASVLILLQLHQRELKPSVLNGARLAALSVIYVAGAVDLFVQPGLGIFALAIGLAIAGIGLGIMFRIRAFLYAGVAFLVLIVGGQLLAFYPEQRLGRAVLLLALGMVITGGMITFNIKREAIVNRIRGMRAGLAQWQ